MLKDLKQSNNEAIAAIRIRQERLIAKSIISHFLAKCAGLQGCARYACPLGRKNGSGYCCIGWEDLSRSECIDKVYEWFKEKVEE